MDKLPPLRRIGRMARERRLAERLSQKELAELAGVHHATVVALEKGEGTLRLVNAWRVLGVLGLAEAGPGGEDPES